jgi:hypothetical protein
MGQSFIEEIPVRTFRRFVSLKSVQVDRHFGFRKAVEFASKTLLKSFSGLKFHRRNPFWLFLEFRVP